MSNFNDYDKWISPEVQRELGRRDLAESDTRDYTRRNNAKEFLRTRGLVSYASYLSHVIGHEAPIARGLYDQVTKEVNVEKQQQRNQERAAEQERRNEEARRFVAESLNTD